MAPCERHSWPIHRRGSSSAAPASPAIAAAYHLAVVHGLDNVVIVEQGNPAVADLGQIDRGLPQLVARPRPGDDRLHEPQHRPHRRDRARDRQPHQSEPPRLRVRDRRCEQDLVPAGRWRRRPRRGAAARRGFTRRRRAPMCRRPSAASTSRSPVRTSSPTRALIRRHFPYLAPETVAVAHARRAGWLSAQQLGMVMLEAARERGVKLVRGRVVGIDTGGGRVRVGSRSSSEGERRSLEATHLVLAAGPMQKEMARLIGVELPIVAERHFKISFPDTLGAVPRAAPMLIWLDEQHLPWSDDERAALADERGDALAAAEVSRRRPWTARRRARRRSSSSTIDGEPVGRRSFRCRSRRTMPRSRCAACRPWCRRCKAYIGKGARPYVDGGYYMQDAREPAADRPVAGRGRLRLGRLLGLRRDGVVRRRRADRPAHHRAARCPTMRRRSCCRAIRTRSTARLLDNWGDGGQL